MVEMRGEPPRVRALAAQGLLVAYNAAASPDEQRRLRIEAYELLHGLVFVQLTRKIENRQGHRDCMASVNALRPNCLDRFHDDMEAVLHDLFRYARLPIHNLEGWVSSRLTSATIDGHRRRRGERGAVQRPRLPRWLADGLGRDERLMALALEMLRWVGVEASAGVQEWPIEAWSTRRAADGSDLEAAGRSVGRDIATVVAAMRQRPRWYAKYVDRPMGHKPLPMVASPRDTEPAPDPAWMALDADTSDDARRAELALLAITAIQARLEAGGDIRDVVVEVVSTMFGAGTGSEDLGRAPGLGNSDDEKVKELLADAETVDRIVAVVLELLQ